MQDRYHQIHQQEQVEDRDSADRPYTELNRCEGQSDEEKCRHGKTPDSASSENSSWFCRLLRGHPGNRARDKSDVDKPHCKSDDNAKSGEWVRQHKLNHEGYKAKANSCEYRAPHKALDLRQRELLKQGSESVHFPSRRSARRPEDSGRPRCWL